MQVAGVQEVGGDPQRREGAGRAGRHREVQPLHVVQAGVRQSHVEGGGGRGGVAERQFRRVHGRMRLLLHQLRLQLVYQATRAGVRLGRGAGQRALQESLQLVVGGQRGEAGHGGVCRWAEVGGRGQLDLGWRPGEGCVDR